MQRRSASSRVQDWTPTIGIALVAVTTYVVYMSLKLDGVMDRQTAAKTEREKAIEDAANATAAVQSKSDRRNRQITYALTVISIFVVALGIKGVHIG